MVPCEYQWQMFAIAMILQAKRKNGKLRGIIFGASEKEIFEIDVRQASGFSNCIFSRGDEF